MLQHKNIVKLHDVITSKGCEHLEKMVKTDSLRPSTAAVAVAAAHYHVNIEEKKKIGDGNVKNDNNQEEKSDKNQGDKQTEITKICGNLYLVFEYVEHDLGECE